MSGFDGDSGCVRATAEYGLFIGGIANQRASRSGKGDGEEPAPAEEGDDGKGDPSGGTD